jgi:hypothetical protein
MSCGKYISRCAVTLVLFWLSAALIHKIVKHDIGRVLKTFNAAFCTNIMYLFSKMDKEKMIFLMATNLSHPVS